MPILDVALAFALTMLVVATVVAKIVRYLKNTLKLRRTELQKMLTEYFSKELQPVVQRELHRLKKTVSDNFAAQLTKTANELTKASHILTKDELEKNIELSTEDLTERLKRSKLGEQLLKELGDKAQTIFDELGRRYEVIGDRFTESFRKHSRSWATGVALVLALVVNIDSIYILDSYIKNEGTRQAVIMQKDTFDKDYNALIKSLEKEEGKNHVTKEELEQAFSDTREQLGFLTSVGFPIGWSYFPHSGLQKEKSKDFQDRNNVWGWALWLLGIAITAILAGRGAPFWYDTVIGISRVARRARAIKKPVAQEK